MNSTLGIATFQIICTGISAAIFTYVAVRVIYLLYFHPLSKFPGPRVAALSDIWYAYHWLSGRWPWVIEDVLRTYGDVVRIAPNELVFFTPRAFQDIYATQQKGLETFIKTDFQNRGKNLGGIVWEEDPVRHRIVARQLAPAFGTRTMRSLEPVVSKHLNHFIARMRDLGSAADGVDLNEWTNWLAMDISADISWNEQFHQMQDARNSVYLDVLLGFNMLTTVIQVFKRSPLISFAKYLFLPIRKLSSLAQMEKAVRESVLRRTERRGRLEHIDYFDFILPDSEPLPDNEQELLHMGSLALQVMFANFGPMADWFYGIILYLLENPECYQILVAEIRGRFASAVEPTPKDLLSLPYLRACMEESLRLLPSNNTGLPRLSPGAIVDGYYVPKGTHVQSSVFALSRSNRFFHAPMQFRPQRWLPSNHPLFDKSFENDKLKSFYAFSLGPRACVGREIAWTQGTQVVGTLLWVFDIIKVPGQRFNLESDLLHYGFLAKPKLMIKFVPVAREWQKQDVCAG